MSEARQLKALEDENRRLKHSTGGKTRLLGINKLGNDYLRRMMLHGAHSVVMQME